MTKKKTNLILILFFGTVLLASTAYGLINDPTPVNIVDTSAFYDHHEWGTWSGSVLGQEGRSGAYFQLSVGVKPKASTFLLSFSDITSVVVGHLETGRWFHLIPDACTNFLGLGYQYWYLPLKPEGWMFAGTWQVNLYYNGSDAQQHEQVKNFTPGPEFFPLKPSYIQVVKTTSNILVSWSGIGKVVSTPIDYRVRIFDATGICPVLDLRVNSSTNPGWYNGNQNKVTFPIDLSWSGHQVRLENRIWTSTGTMSRSWQELMLP
jgi:hypothetical protein